MARSLRGLLVLPLAIAAVGLAGGARPAFGHSPCPGGLEWLCQQVAQQDATLAQMHHRLDQQEDELDQQRQRLSALQHEVDQLRKKGHGGKCSGCAEGEAPVCCPLGDGFCPLVGCTNLASDAANCGACGNACAAGEQCAGGACACGAGPACAAGMMCLGGTCSAPCGTTPETARASCKEIHATCPTLLNGVYWIAPGGGQPFQAYCEMTLDGGGWTAFYAGIEGTPNVFNHFELTAADCTDPASHCMRRLPSSATTATEFAARCGDAALKFQIDSGALAYFQSGTQGIWRNTSNVVALAGNAHTDAAAQFFTGTGTNYGWILGFGDARWAWTFASSYNSGGEFSYCNGVYDTTSPVKLFYR